MTLYEFIIQVIDIKLNSPSLYPILSITLQLPISHYHFFGRKDTCLNVTDKFHQWVYRYRAIFISLYFTIPDIVSTGNRSIVQKL